METKLERVYREMQETLRLGPTPKAETVWPKLRRFPDRVTIPRREE